MRTWIAGLLFGLAACGSNDANSAKLERELRTAAEAVCTCQTKECAEAAIASMQRVWAAHTTPLRGKAAARVAEIRKLSRQCARTQGLTADY